MYCKQCGNLINDNSIFCEYCGTKVDNVNTNSGSSSTNTPKKNNVWALICWGTLAFFLPIIGFVLFVILRKEKAKRNTYLLIGSIIGFVAYVFLVVIIIISFVFNLLSESYTNKYKEDTSGAVIEVTETLRLKDNNKFTLTSVSNEEYDNGILYPAVKGDVECETTLIEYGTYNFVSETKVALNTEYIIIQVDVDGDGEDQYLNFMRQYYSEMFGDPEIGDLIASEKAVKLEIYESESVYVNINKEDRSFSIAY